MRQMTFNELRLWGGSLMSFHCRCCRIEVSQGKRDHEAIGAFFGCEPKGGTTLGRRPIDIAFQKRIARAAQRHYLKEHADHPMMRIAPWLQENRG